MWIRPSTGVSCVYPWCDKNLFVAIVWFHLCVRLQVERKIGVSSESRYKRMISPTNRNSFQSEILHRRRAKQFSVLSTCFPGSTLHTWNKHPQISLPALQKSSLRWNMPLILFREGRLFFEVADRCKESRLTSYSDLVCSVIFKHPPGINGFRFGLTL